MQGDTDSTTGGPRCPVGPSHGKPRLDVIKDDLRVYRCPVCGTFIADAEYDPESYMGEGREPVDLTVEDVLDRWGYRWGIILNAIAAMCPPPARLLDVGAGNGGFLYLARERGYDGQGVTMSSRDVQYARGTLGVSMSQGTLEGLQGGNYDIVVATSVIEHVEDPARFMMALAERSRPGGFVGVATPNPNAYRRLLGGSGRWTMLRSEHLNVLSRRALEELAARAGLAPVTFLTASMYLRGLERGLGPLAPAVRSVAAKIIQVMGVGGDQVLVARKDE